MRALILGLAKTGTTGIYNLIKNSMKIVAPMSYFVFEPSSRSQLKSIIENAPNLPFLTKIMIARLDKTPPQLNQFNKKIMIVRDPRDMLVSHLLFRPFIRANLNDNKLDKFLSLIEKKENDPDSIGLFELHEKADQLKIGMLNMEILFELLAKQKAIVERSKFFMCKYESFIAKDFASLEDYLEMPLLGSSVGGEWLSHITRSKGCNEWRKWFTAEDVEYLRNKAGWFLEYFDYGEEWSLERHEKINPDFSSRHIKKKYNNRVSQKELLEPNNPTFPANREEFKLLVSKADDGAANNMFKLGSLYLNGSSFCKKDTQLAYYWLEAAAIQGEPNATELLNAMCKSEQYFTRRGIENLV